MGVTGLWRLIEPAGKPVPVESLENKVLAVDISIWLHQVVKGYQDAKGAPLPNAHLIGLFQRLCKLLYFRIKPVFVFDGAYPDLKRETIAKRQDNKNKYNSESERLKREIALLLGKKTALGSLLGTQISPKKNKNTQAQTNNDDLFKLPALPQKEEESESDSEDEQNSSASTVDLHSVDIESDDFKSMPVKEKYDLLVELKDTRKMNSWGKLHTLPKKSDNFSDFQMQRLLKRRKVQECLQETEKEMGDIGMSLNELESFLNEEGIDTKIDYLPTRRIASNNTTRFILINDVQEAIANAKKREEAESSKAQEEQAKNTREILKNDFHETIKISSECKHEPTNVENILPINKNTESDEDLQKAIKMSLECKGESSNVDDVIQINKKTELDEDLEKAIKMSLECVEEPNTSTSRTDESWTSCKSDTDCTDIGSDSEDEDGFEQPDYSTAKAYIMQYSDFTYNAIDNIVASKAKCNNKIKKRNQDVNDIIKELNHDRSVIVDKFDLSSDEEQQTIDTDTRKVINSSSSSTLDSKQIDNTVDTKTELRKRDHMNTIVDMDMTQSSVVCVENSADVIALDTSSDENQEKTIRAIKTNDLSIENQSETDDDEFEEVSDITKPSIEVTLDVPNTIDNDIFADVFDKKYLKSNIPTEILKDKNDLRTPETLNVSRNDSNENAIDSSNIVQKLTSAEVKNDTHKNVELTDIVSNSKTWGRDELPEKIRNDVKKPCNEHVKNVISTEALNTMVAEIESEEQNLRQEKGRMERIGRNITEQMTKEAQELLQIFGIPYIVAPMEAEAQCAFLESINLTHGTITDDSDIWLFGGKTVYKNFFNQKKHVLQFLSEKIEKSFNLSREQLILLALLVGSDYTTGVSGVGPVTALEILASFPFNKKQLHKEDSRHVQYQLIVTGLQEFKKWVLAGRRTDNINLKKKLRNVSLGDDFPSVRVVQAYLDPNVEKSKENFTWGKLDITILRDYAKAKFGWSQNKLDVILQPVIKRMQENKTQKTVQDYFKRKISFQCLEDQMSRRVKAAVQKMDTENEGLSSTTMQDSKDETQLKAGKKRKGKTKQLDDVPSSSAKGGKAKKKKVVEAVKVCTATADGIEINVTKTDRYQEIIPQRENDMKNILQNKLKAIEIFRKTNIDRKRKPVKRRMNLPKDKAELSESSDSN